MKQSKKTNRVSVVITVKNESRTIKSLLDSLENQTVHPEEMVIVDGGSFDGTVKIIKKRVKNNKKIKLIICKGASIARGRNIGVLNSIGELIVMIDAGCVADKNWLFNITKPLLARPEIGIVSGTYKMVSKSLFHETIKPYLGVPYKLVSLNFLPSARSMAFRKLVWEKIGGFSESLERTGEDTLFNYQAKKQEIEFGFAKNAIVEWEVPGTLKEFFKKVYYYAKGDAQTGIWWHSEKRLSTHNIRILTIYFRYLIGLILIILSLSQPIFLRILGFCIFLYFIWVALKNYYRVEKKLALILSPLIQIISDIAVMLGFFSGILSKL